MLKMRYDTYNREERALCFHLFRLLHEGLVSNPKGSGLSRVLNALSAKGIKPANAEAPVDVSQLTFRNVAIYPEVALIRDVYFASKSSPDAFMDQLVRIIQQQEKVSQCTLYSQLPEVLRNPSKTHPAQIRRKAAEVKPSLSNQDLRVYGALQGMFNAKPDFAITIDGLLLTLEAKFTQVFEKAQLDRTLNITEVWASLLYSDLGFEAPPAYTVVKLGLAKTKPDLSWQEVLSIASEFYVEPDRSLTAFRNALNFDLETKA